ncbi:MAG: hypothetical protein ACKOA1_09710, partial [Bacteroidota bacterium]
MRNSSILIFSFILPVVSLFRTSIVFSQEIKWSQEQVESRRLPYLKIIGAGAKCFYSVRSDAPMIDLLEAEDRKAS